MKRIILLGMAGILFLNCQAQGFEKIKDPLSGQTLLKGFINDRMLSDTAAFKWYGEMQKGYLPNPAVVSTVAATKDSISFLVFLGTWCTDSHYVIPRFFKILETAGFDKNKVVLIALDRSKKDAANLAPLFGIGHVPTIIVVKNGTEIGRVVEFGVTGKFDEELAAIIKKA